MRDHPVMLVPTGGFYGLKNSTTVKALLDEYVKNGGTLVLFTQQHGYDWDLLPVPSIQKPGKESLLWATVIKRTRAVSLTQSI